MREAIAMMYGNGLLWGWMMVLPLLWLLLLGVIVWAAIRLAHAIPKSLWLASAAKTAAPRRCWHITPAIR